MSCAFAYQYWMTKKMTQFSEASELSERCVPDFV